ncbi:TonB-dependent receptor [Sphingomonas sp. 35-24ZXX]|uniref:TonB-dependent receptor n=1 Tax=Sphingomonas sp. 35-24ZXX TaxID=1545915 RepID=UPI00053BE950|nr:TonB-dependent receptor [Sphingomonas sp. 35-24ZXX]
MLSITSLLLASASAAAMNVPATAAAADAAVAQDAEADAGVVANIIIVQARRRDEAVQDVPAVINVVAAESIEKLNLREFNEVSRLVPGLELTNNANGIGGNARLRGVNFDTNASGNNATVEFYFNDAPISAGIILQQMFDIGQIEVQRGPQGTLRGRASPSGAITVTARKPDLNEFGGFVDWTANDIGTLNFKGGVNIPVIPGIAGIRVSGVFDENELDRVRPINRTLGARDPFSRTKGGRIVALIEPADWIRLEGTFQRLDRNGRSYEQAISFREINPAATASPVRIRAQDRLSIQEEPRIVRQRFDIYNWRAELANWGQRLIYQGSHTKQRIFSTDNQDFGNFFPNRDIQQITNTRATGTSHEVRLQNEERIFDIFDYVIGFFDNKLSSPTTLTRPTVVRLPAAFGGGIAQVVQTPIQRGNQTHEQSFFGHLTAHIGENTEISGGLRQIDYSQDSSLVVNGARLVNLNLDQSKLIYSASIKHNFSPDFLVYASTGSSWRPGINIVGNFNIAQSALERAFTDLPPESSRSYEAGFKSTLLDGKLLFNMTAYHQTFKNFPYRIPNRGVFYVNTVALRNPATGAVTGTAQEVASFNFAGAVPVEVNGIEGELSYQVTNRWSVGLVASYSLGKIKNGTIPCTDLNSDGRPDAVTTAPTLAALRAAVGANNISACRVNQRSAFVPPFSATLQSEYTLPISDKVDGYIRGLFNYSGKSQGDPANAFDQVDDFGLLSLYAGIRAPDGQWEVSLFAKNLFDTVQTLTRTDPLFTSFQQLNFGGQFANGQPVFTGTTPTTVTSTYTGGTVTPPREFGLNFRFFFGSR